MGMARDGASAVLETSQSISSETPPFYRIQSIAYFTRLAQF
jgi:hypothetical protein